MITIRNKHSRVLWHPWLGSVIGIRTSSKLKLLTTVALNQESMTGDSNVFEIWTENYKLETFAKLSEIQMTTYGIITNWVDGSSKVFRFQDWGELSVVSVVSWVPAFWSLPDLTFSFTAFAHTVSLPGMQWNLLESALGGSGKVWGTISGYVGQTSTRLGLWPPSRGTTHQNCALSQEKTRICRRKKVSGGFIRL